MGLVDAPTMADESPLEFIALLPEDGSSGRDFEAVTSSGAAHSDPLAAMATEAASKHWSTTRQYHSTASLELTLHEEMIDFSEAYRPTRAEHAARVGAIERVRELVAGLPSFASAEVHPFGSFATGIYLPSSDIDLVVLDSGHVQKAEQVEGLRLLESALRSASWRAEHIEVIGSAKVPIVKYLDCVSGLAVDICLETRDGLRSSALARKAAERFPAFRHLVLLLKRWLISRGLNDTFTGGVGSFLLMLLVIASLQQPPLQPPTLPGTQHNLGRCLLHFFEMFGMRLNTIAVGIRVADGGRFFDKRQRGWLNDERPWLLCVENPIDSTHDVGANAFNFRSVRRACAHAYCSLLSADARKQRGEDAGSKRESGFLPWDHTSTNGQVTGGPRRLRLLSSFLDIECEMARRFEMHAAEANEPIASLEATSEAVEFDSAAWEAMGGAELHGEEEDEEASASCSSDEGNAGEADAARDAYGDGEMRDWGPDEESEECGEAGVSDSDSAGSEMVPLPRTLHGRASPRAGKARAASAATSAKAGPSGFESRRQRREAAARARPQVERVGVGLLRGIGKKARAALARGKKAASKLRADNARPAPSPSQSGRSPAGKAKARASSIGNATLAQKGASPKKGKRTIPAVTLGRDATPIRRKKDTPMAKKPSTLKKQPADIVRRMATRPKSSPR